MDHVCVCVCVGCLERGRLKGAHVTAVAFENTVYSGVIHGIVQRHSAKTIRSQAAEG